MVRVRQAFDTYMQGEISESSIINNSLTKKTVKGLFHVGLGSGVQMVSQIVFLVILARLLTPYDFGLLAAVMTVIGISQILMSGAITQAVVQWPNITEEEIVSLFTLSILSSCFLFGVVCLLSPILSMFYRMPGLTVLLRVGSLAIVFQGFGLVATGLCARKMTFGVITKIEALSYILGQGGVGIALAYCGVGAWALIGGNLVYTIFRTTALLYLRLHPLRLRFDKNFFLRVSRIGAGISMANVCNFIATQGDNFITGRYLGVSSLGIYSRAYQLVSFPAALFGRIGARVAFPAISRASLDEERLSGAHSRAVNLTSFVVLPLSVFMIFLAPEIISIVLGPQWGDVVLPFSILSICIYFRTGYKVHDVVIRASGDTKLYFGVNFVYSFLIIIACIIGVNFGVLGICWAVTFSIFLCYLVMAFAAVKRSKLERKKLLSSYFPAIYHTVSYIVTLFLILPLLRKLENDFIVCFVSLLVCVFSSLILIRIDSKIFLGEHCSSVLKSLFSKE